MRRPLFGIIFIIKYYQLQRTGFDDGYYAEAAFKEINLRVKKVYKDRTSIEEDGNKLMLAALSAQNPVIKSGIYRQKQELIFNRGIWRCLPGQC